MIPASQMSHQRFASTESAYLFQLPFQTTLHEVHSFLKTFQLPRKHPKTIPQKNYGPAKALTRP